MSQITYSDDIRVCSTASNIDSSIRWHVYERASDDSPGFQGIYLRRQLNRGNLEPEIQLVSIGTNPKILFIANQWVLLYTFASRVIRVTYLLDEIPTKITIPFNQVGEANGSSTLFGVSVGVV